MWFSLYLFKHNNYFLIHLQKSKSGVQKPLPIRGTSLPLIEIHASPMRQKQLMKSSMHAMPVMNGIVDVPLFNVPVVFEEDDDKLYCICRLVILNKYL